MRVIAGRWRGRSLLVPRGDATRPTADRVRQALFDMLAHAPWAPPEGLAGRRVLDAFAGSGALGIEALSRGAACAAFLDRDPAALACVRRNLGADAGPQAIVLRADATRPPPSAFGADLVFLDPPYAADVLASAVAALSRTGWIAPACILVAETAATGSADLPGMRLAERRHGPALLTVARLPV